MWPYSGSQRDLPTQRWPSSQLPPRALKVQASAIRQEKEIEINKARTET